MTGKFGKTRKMRVDDAFIAAWNAHVARFAIAPNGYMFFFRSPRFIAQDTYEWVIDKSKACGAKPFQRFCTMVQAEAERQLPPELNPNFKVTPHVLRRTFACIKLIEHALGLGGMDLVTLQGVMGHEDLATTREYLADVDSYLRSISPGDTNTLDAADEIVRRRNELLEAAEGGEA